MDKQMVGGKVFHKHKDLGQFPIQSAQILKASG